MFSIMACQTWKFCLCAQISKGKSRTLSIVVQCCLLYFQFPFTFVGKLIFFFFFFVPFPIDGTTNSQRLSNPSINLYRYFKAWGKWQLIFIFASEHLRTRSLQLLRNEWDINSALIPRDIQTGQYMLSIFFLQMMLHFWHKDNFYV